MKLRIGNNIYLQKYDVAFIMNDELEVPHSFYQEAKINFSSFSIKSVEDQYTFGCVFKDKETIDWINNQDWLLDFNHWRSLPRSEIESIRDGIIKQYNDYAEHFYDQNEEYQKEHYYNFNTKRAKEEHFIYSLNSLIYFLDKKDALPLWIISDEATRLYLANNPIPGLRLKTQGTSPPIKKPSFLEKLFSLGLNQSAPR